MSVKNNKNVCFIHEKTALIVIVAAALILVSLVIFSGVFSKKQENLAEDETTLPTPSYLNISETEASETVAETTGTPVVTAANDADCQKIKVDNAEIKTGDLILVNSSYAFSFPDDFESKELIKVKKTYGAENYLYSSGSEKLLPQAAKAMNDMLTDFKKATKLSDVMLSYCYVDYKTQDNYYKKQEKANAQEASVWTKKAGFSEHHTGLAFNLNVYKKDVEIGEETYKWITDHCAEYGVIRRFPENKRNITYEKNEANHFRYVGVPHAAFIEENGLCLEEYITSVREYDYSKPLSMTVGEETYYIYFVAADLTSEDTEIKVPVNSEYTISGNNIDGFIVTARI